MGSAVMQIIFASALYDANHKKVWSNPDLVDDEVDELVVLTNEKWLLLLNRIATLERENAAFRLHIQEAADDALSSNLRWWHLAALQPKEPNNVE